MGCVVCTFCHEVAPHGAAGFSFLDGAVSVPFVPICHLRGIGFVWCGVSCGESK